MISPAGKSRAVSPEDAQELRFLTLNISGPSVSRAERLLDYLAGLDADAMVLTETRATPGTAYLLDAYRSAGYHVLAPARLDPAERGVAIIHRLPVARLRPPVSIDLAHRLLVTRLDLDPPITLVGVYVPSRDASQEKIRRKQVFLQQMLTYLRAVSDQTVVVLGDFNIVSRCHEPRYSAFRSWEYDAFSEVDGCGLVDAFAAVHPGMHAYSWFGRTGDGYRYDYAFLGGPLVSRIRDCRYIDETRALRLSDHAGLLLTVAAPPYQAMTLDLPNRSAAAVLV